MHGLQKTFVHEKHESHEKNQNTFITVFVLIFAFNFLDVFVFFVPFVDKSVLNSQGISVNVPTLFFSTVSRLVVINT